ncbi:hypothetical protein BU23DRAFT_550229 [Bimuria novae-zelandiae CBS 107.79]|uniref:Uncharacterized protein n=1 Tax=Bimuria novae-zelandiae CBS 107.79 TaxID=1447943 RepID=A0A6A5VKD1_9PLEO|nr:hypothetical protein BU23DRAFT_550229 [Bimuria novae-zelandiae CBS 107.79]
MDVIHTPNAPTNPSTSLPLPTISSTPPPTASPKSVLPPTPTPPLTPSSHSLTALSTRKWLFQKSTLHATNNTPCSLIHPGVTRAR